MIRKFNILLEDALNVHPLDRTVPSGWGDLEMPEDNYHYRVLGRLVSIMQEAQQISEKSFSLIRGVVAIANKLVREHDDVVRESELNGVRPALCAELIYQMSGQS